ncbi:MAG: hypothetical protein R3301_19790 [Saprospiraceae bacterium]|nr:hypothetical protein [Saprospiraceae bacterium]
MSQKGCTQFTVVFTVAPEHVAEGDRIFQSHANWMARTHHRDGEKQLLRYNLSKAPQMVNPMDPGQGTTDNTCYVLSEVYANPAGLQDHWEQAQANWEDFGALNDWLGKVDSLMVNGSTIVHSLWD